MKSNPTISDKTARDNTKNYLLSQTIIFHLKMFLYELKAAQKEDEQNSLHSPWFVFTKTS